MVISRPLSPLVTLYRLRSRDHLKKIIYTVVSQYILRGDADHVRCAGDKARSQPYDQHPRHRDDRLLPVAARMPHPLELPKEYRILADRRPRVLDEGSPDEPRAHAGDVPPVYGLSCRVFATGEAHKTRDLFPARKPGEILPQFEDKTNGGEPADPREAPGDGIGLVVALLFAELLERSSEGNLVGPELF